MSLKSKIGKMGLPGKIMIGLGLGIAGGLFYFSIPQLLPRLSLNQQRVLLKLTIRLFGTTIGLGSLMALVALV